MYIHHNNALATIEISDLVEVGRNLVIEDNAALTSVTISELEKIDGTLRMNNNPSLAVISLPELIEAGGINVVGDPTVLFNCDLGVLYTTTEICY